MDEEVVGTLEQWSRGPINDEGEFVFFGSIYGDKKGRFYDGTSIHTSGSFDSEAVEGDVITTRNNRYLLGSKADEG